MRILVSLVLSLVSVTAFGFSECVKPTPAKPAAPACIKPSVKVKAQPAAPKQTKTPAPTPAPAPTASPCCEKGSVDVSTGNQTVTVNVQPQTPQVVVRRVYLRSEPKIVTRRITLVSPNRLQVLLGASKSEPKLVPRGCCKFSVENRHEFDPGAQYLRDIGSFTGSVMGTLNGNVYLGLGINW